MKHKYQIVISVILSSLFLSGCGGGFKAFNMAEFERFPEKISAKYIESHGIENIKSYAFQRVAILEFNVEFRVDLPDTNYSQITDEMYEIFSSTLTSVAGWDVVRKNLVINTPVYRQLKRSIQEEQTGKRRRKRDASKAKNTLRSATGLGIISSDSRSKSGGSARRSGSLTIEAGILEDVDANAGLKVYTIVDFTKRKEDDGRAVLVSGTKKMPRTSKVDILIGYRKTPSPGIGYRARDGKEYIYNYKTQCSFSLKHPVVSFDSIYSKQGTFDLDEFSFQVRDMYGIYAEMLATEISKSL